MIEMCTFLICTSIQFFVDVTAQCYSSSLTFNEHTPRCSTKTEMFHFLHMFFEFLKFLIFLSVVFFVWFFFSGNTQPPKSQSFFNHLPSGTHVFWHTKPFFACIFVQPRLKKWGEKLHRKRKKKKDTHRFKRVFWFLWIRVRFFHISHLLISIYHL